MMTADEVPIVQERLKQLYPDQTTYSFPEIGAARYTCPLHNLPLKGRLHEVKSGYSETPRGTLLLGACPKEGCGFLLDIKLDYSVVMREGHP